MTKEIQPVPYSHYWPCACVRRDKMLNMTAIKQHHPQMKKCRTCGAERPEGWLDEIKSNN